MQRRKTACRGTIEAAPSWLLHDQHLNDERRSRRRTPSSAESRSRLSVRSRVADARSGMARQKSNERGGHEHDRPDAKSGARQPQTNFVIMVRSKTINIFIKAADH